LPRLRERLVCLSACLGFCHFLEPRYDVPADVNRGRIAALCTRTQRLHRLNHGKLCPQDNLTFA
jgi:hypothetical protein